jgi:hypothetical protein
MGSQETTDTLDSKLQHIYKPLYDTVKRQNDRLEEQINDLVNNAVSSQKSIYINQSSQILQTVYNYAILGYFFVAIILCVLIGRKPEYSISMKFIIIVLLLTFPFYIYPLEKITLIISDYFTALFFSLVYTNGYA